MDNMDSKLEASIRHVLGDLNPEGKRA